MKKVLLVCTMLCASLFAQRANVTVQDTLFLADGTTPFTGTLTIKWPTFVLAGRQVGLGAMNVQVSSGALSVALWPSDQALVFNPDDTAQFSTGFLYTVTATSAQGPIINFWLVPSSAANTTVTLSKVRAPTGGGGSGTGNVSAAGTLTSTACVSGAGTTNIQTPSSNCTIDSSGNVIVQSISTGGAAQNFTGINIVSGVTTGGVGFTTPDSSGSLIYYVVPAGGGAGQTLTNTGSTTCPTLDSHVPTPTACQLLAWVTPIKSCVVTIGDPGAGSPVLANDNDSPEVCKNISGASQAIVSVSCWSDAGSPTVTPILTGGSGTSILSGALTCSQTAGGAAGTLNGTPSLGTNVTIDANITAAGGTAKYVVITIGVQ